MNGNRKRAGIVRKWPAEGEEWRRERKRIGGRKRGRELLGAPCAPEGAEGMKRCDLSALALASDYPFVQAGPLEQKESVDSRRRLLQLGSVVEAAAAAQQAGPAGNPTSRLCPMLRWDEDDLYFDSMAEL